MAPKGLRDRHGRIIGYLRVSLTDRCNLRCVYCLPEEGVALKRHADILTLEEVRRVVQAAVSLGVKHVRLTGGEPLVRKGLVDLVAGLAAIPGLEDLSLTTNGALLAECAGQLRRAGLDRVNISLDTLRPDRFALITRRPLFAETMAGIRSALEVGFDPVKLNVVLMRGLNEDEIIDFARLTRRPLAPGSGPLHVRFIELMPLGCGGDGWQERFVSSAEVRARLGELEPLPREEGSSAQRYRRPGGAAVLGFISPVSAPFCAACTRLRVTAAGKLRPCLRRALEVDLRPLLGEPDAAAHLGRVLQELAAQKPTADGAARSPVGASAMCSIGG